MNAFPCTFQYTTGAHMNTHYTACMMAHPVCKINVNFTSLVQMTFICTCANCNSELAYSGRHINKDTLISKTNGDLISNETQECILLLIQGVQ